MKKVPCQGCGESLENDEIAFYLHLNGRGAFRFLCLNCLAKTYGCTKSSLEEKLQIVKNGGCEFFKQQYL